MFAKDYAIQCAGETMWPLSEHTLWWLAQRVLIVANTRFGKAVTFRTRDVPVSAGNTNQAVIRLDAMLAKLPVAHIAWLGDLLHAHEAHAAIDAFAAWRARHAEVACTLVRGNHDRHAGSPPADLRFNMVEEPWAIGPFALCHEPRWTPDRYIITGCVHLGVIISGPAWGRLQLPYFRFRATGALLPAFSEFTDLWTAPAAPGGALFAVANGYTWPLPS